MTAATTCVQCGKCVKTIEAHLDLQLKVASIDVNCGTSIRNLLDDYFSDENLEGIEGDTCCGDLRKWRSFRLDDCPQDPILTLTRYDFKKDRALKVRTQILVDPIINLARYTDNNDDILYRLKGAVVHQGISPRSGHYTYVDTGGPSQIVVDDDKIYLNQSNVISRDGYILRYERIPTESVAPVMLPNILVCLKHTHALSLAIDRYFIEDMLSIRQRKLVECFSDMDITETKVIHGQTVLKLLSEGLFNVHIAGSVDQAAETPANLIIKTLDYFFNQGIGILKKAFGVSYLLVQNCTLCGQSEVTECHNVLFNCPEITSEVAVRQCPQCKEHGYREQKIFTHFDIH